MVQFLAPGKQIILETLLGTTARVRKSRRAWELFLTGAAAMASTLTQQQSSAVAAAAVAATPETPPAPQAAKPKKLHGRAFYESIGSPKFILAPMVDQSEFVS